MSRRRRIRASARDGFDLRLPDEERALIANLPGQVIAALAALAEARGTSGAAASDPAAGPQEAARRAGSDAGWESAREPWPVDMPEELGRLFPVAYPRDADAQRAFFAVSGDDLLAHHREALELLVSTARSSHLEAGQLEQWLSGLNDLRLVLGASLGVTEDHEAPEPDDPRLREWVCYDYLAMLVNEVVDALSGVLPPPIPGADDHLPEDPWGDAPGDLRWDGTPRPSL